MDSNKDTRIEVRPRRRRGDTEMDITPMIDMTFLLLSFFIMCSTMRPTTPVDLPSAQYGVNVREQNAEIIIVAATTGEDPVVFLGPAKLEEFRAFGSLGEIEEKIENYVATQLLDQTKTTVIIKAEREAKVRHVQMVKHAVSAGLPENRYLHIGIEEQ